MIGPYLDSLVIPSIETDLSLNPMLTTAVQLNDLAQPVIHGLECFLK